MMKRGLLFLLMTTLFLALAACGGSEPAPPEPVSFTIEMTEYAYDPSELTVSVGQEVTLNLINKGQLEHEIMIGRDMVTENGIPNGYAVDFFEFAGVEPHVDGGMLMIDGEMIMEGSGDMAMEESDDMAMEESDDMAMDESEHDDEHSDDMAMEEADSGHGHDGLMVMLPKTGDTATMSFVVTEEMVGTWEIGCFQLDGVHYNSGMKGTLTVTDS
jgi:plastocyanin